jgi:hypothetical protein
MKKDIGNAACTTNDKGFGPGSTKGIPASTMSISTGTANKGNTAKFSAGKKTVSK